MASSLLADARLDMPEMVRFRRAMHRHPEVGTDLPHTRGLILDALGDLDLEVQQHQRSSGVVAVMRGPRSDAPPVLLRADNDGLPVAEDTGLDFSSETGSTMHACGHDLHTAMLLGAARLLDGRRDSLRSPVVFMFQPGEEGHHGAEFMLDEGLLDAAGSKPSRAFAIHVFATMESGKVYLKEGPAMAASDQFHITLTGVGGHASSPHLSVDPVPAAAEIVLALQAAVTRRFSAHDPIVVTVGHLDAGSAANVIPERAFLHGTIRTFSDATRSAAHELVAQVVEGVAAAHGVGADPRIDIGYPVTVNEPEETTRIGDLARQLVGDDRVVMMTDPLMVAEDWSYVLRQVPGAMAFLGARPPSVDPDAAPMNHSDRVVFDEDAMVVGAALYAAAALDSIGI